MSFVKQARRILRHCLSRTKPYLTPSTSQSVADPISRPSVRTKVVSKSSCELITVLSQPCMGRPKVKQISDGVLDHTSTGSSQESSIQFTILNRNPAPWEDACCSLSPSFPSGGSLGE
ncbi:hypothetical protein VTI28DRAFT_1371 [Corynascus sepedonium]